MEEGCHECISCNDLKDRVDKNERYYMPIANDAKHMFETLPKIVHDIEQDIVRQESSLKSMHKRLDEDSVDRKETARLVRKFASDFEAHMTNEEFFHKIIVGGGALVFSAAAWLFIEIIDIKENEATTIEWQKNHVESKNTILKKLDEQGAIMIDLMVHLKSHGDK